MYREKSFEWILFKLLFLFLILASFYAWFTWEIHKLLPILVFCIVGFFLMFKNYYNSNKTGISWFLLIVLTLVLGSLRTSIENIGGLIIGVFPLLFIIMLKPVYKEDLLKTTMKVLEVIMLLSVIGWVLHLLGFSIPYTIVSYGITEGGEEQYLFENHYLFLSNITTRLADLLLPRFSSVFLEPGYLGCLMAVCLYIGKYQINRRNIIFGIALFLSYSLAGFLLFFLGLSVKYFSLSKKSLKYILWLLFIIVLFVWGAKIVNQGDNLVNELIFSRLKYSEYNMISGYNRSGVDFSRWFWTKFIYSDDVLLGTTTTMIGNNDVDWKAYIVRSGLLSFIFYVLFLIHPVFKSKNKRNCIFCALLFFLIFAQTIALSMSLMYLSLFVLYINRINTMSIIGNENVKSRGQKVFASTACT